MSELLQVLKCEEGAFTVEIVNPKGGCGELTCCGKPMKIMNEKGAAAEGKEKHVPVKKKGKSGVKVEVGSVPHPMEEDHYIEWIEVINCPYVNRKHLKPGDKPEAEFYVPDQDGIIIRAYCNKHGLWRA